MITLAIIICFTLLCNKNGPVFTLQPYFRLVLGLKHVDLNLLESGVF